MKIIMSTVATMGVTAVLNLVSMDLRIIADVMGLNVLIRRMPLILAVIHICTHSGSSISLTSTLSLIPAVR